MNQGPSGRQNSPHRGEVYKAYYFEPDSATGGEFFNEEGKSLRKAFLKAPLKFSRITSHYSLHRFHPVQKRWKAHLGTDYARSHGYADSCHRQRCGNSLAVYPLQWQLCENKTQWHLYYSIPAHEQAGSEGGAACSPGPIDRVCRHDRAGHRSACLLPFLEKRQTGRSSKTKVSRGNACSTKIYTCLPAIGGISKRSP